MIIQEPVQAAIWHCLNHYDFSDAIFLAERLCAEVESDETLFLLATCYYRSGKTWQAYCVLRKKGSNSPQCRYLMAKCCLELQRLAEAENVLLGADPVKSRGLDDLVSEFGDQACFALQILARICMQTERGPKASEALRRALKLNPFLWHAFEDLCNRGEKPDPLRTFQVSNLENFSNCHGSNPVVNFINSCDQPSSCTTSTTTSLSEPAFTISSTPIQTVGCVSAAIPNAPNMKFFTPDESPLARPLCGAGLSGISVLAPTRIKPRFRNMFGGGGCITPINPSFGFLPMDTPNSGDPTPVAFLSPTLTESNDQQKSLAKRQFMSRKETPLQQSKPVFSQSSNTSNTSNIVPSQSPTTPAAPLQPGQNVRRSSRLFSNSYNVKENNKSPNRSKFATPKSPSRKTKSRIAKTNLNKASFTDLNERNRNEKEKSETITSADSKIIGSGMVSVNGGTASQNTVVQVLQLQKQSAEGLMSLLRDLGTAYLHLAQFNCRKAVECFNNLPLQHYNTGWVLALMGRAHYELNEYQLAVKYFNEVREREPHRMQLMELYSTSLWHLQREVALSALAQDLVSQDRNSPAAWCATGNCFSLQKEHDSAIKFFQRAVQVDPSFVYAYTLLGHEYVTTEELDKALSCFRSAIRIDSRHYNAWYGIGTIYSKQERYLLAELHFKKALSINPQSAVLMCHIGVVQHALQKTEKALQTLNAAIATDPKNALCKFHRASIYFAAGRHNDALKELEELKEIVPKESLVYYLTGKVHKKLGNTHLALMHFSWATDLDPKGANSQIKEAIDPAMSRNLGEEDPSAAHPGEDFPSEGCSSHVHESSSQEGAEFVTLHATDSDESL
ncbi:hypothetical protein R5R35_000639 [Gryllus longicercus]|uniref:Cell division cycle protein 27 homolog n=1 Tax=Gryllus longicercus TaxID=2509291 RepID=A0AAN9VQ54_9ORTH